jgi:gp16 family phage-associated protein
MTAAKIQSNDIKHALRVEHQLTLKQFAAQYGFNYRDVCDVVRGLRACNYGTSRVIWEKLNSLVGSVMTDKKAA